MIQHVFLNNLAIEEEKKCYLYDVEYEEIFLKHHFSHNLMQNQRSLLHKNLSKLTKFIIFCKIHVFLICLTAMSIFFIN